MKLQHVLRALAITAVAATAVIVPATDASAADPDVALVCFPHAQSAELRYDDTWGASRSGGRGHQGTDIMSPKGLEVRAVADGVVTTLKDGSKSGYYVRLVHEGDWESWYMHLNNDDPGTDNGRGGAGTAYAAGLTEGTIVRAGDVIGYVGDSGNAEWTGSHTHFELHIDGNPVNPYTYLVDVQQREDLLLEAVIDLAFPAVSEPEQIRQNTLQHQLTAARGADCLPDAYRDIVERLVGDALDQPDALPQVEVR